MTEERQDFEKWAKDSLSGGDELDLTRIKASYFWTDTDIAWKSWQASRRSTLEEVERGLRGLEAGTSESCGLDRAADYVKGLARDGR